MKQFTEAELKELVDQAKDEGFGEGYNAGFANGEQWTNYNIRGKVANQRRELRRLNAKLNEFYNGLKYGKEQKMEVSVD